MGSANVLPFGSKTAKGYIDTMLDSKGGLGPRITKRYGHPSNYRSDGYDIGLRVRICAVLNGSTKSLSDHPLFDWNDVPYIAPEALLEQPYSKSMDMWSVGVLIYLMIAGDLPFANSDDDKVLLNAIKHAQYSFDENPVWANVKDIIKALIGKLLISNPTQRLTAREMLKDPWILTGY
eukprot:scaffold2913_cov181-Ochromonas_danica.AAC.27